MVPNRKFLQNSPLAGTVKTIGPVLGTFLNLYSCLQTHWACAPFIKSIWTILRVCQTQIGHAISPLVQSIITWTEFVFVFASFVNEVLNRSDYINMWEFTKLLDGFQCWELLRRVNKRRQNSRQKYACLQLNQLTTNRNTNTTYSEFSGDWRYRSRNWRYKSRK